VVGVPVIPNPLMNTKLRSERITERAGAGRAANECQPNEPWSGGFLFR